jgi:hypothetical protein
LVEVMVVFVIIGILAALVLPAVQSARESSRRSVCSGRLSQLAMAMIQFEQRFGFVPGWKNLHPRAELPARVAWPVLLLPFIGRNDVHGRWADGHQDISYIDSFVCPSSPPPDSVKPWLSYAGNVGAGTNARSAGYGHPTRWDGLMLDTTVRSGANSGLRPFGEIAEKGLGRTIAFAEKCGPGRVPGGELSPAKWDYLPSGVNSGNFSWGGNTENSVTPWIGIAPGGGVGDWSYAYSNARKLINNTTDNSAPGFRSQPSGMHAGSAVLAFCDGRTVFTAPQFDSGLYTVLLSTNLQRSQLGVRNNVQLPTNYRSWQFNPLYFHGEDWYIR